jgi:hypothetical protein
MTAAAPYAESPSRELGPGRILLIALGSFVALVGAALLVAGGAALWVDQTRRDDAGFVNTSTEQFVTRSYALTSSPFRLELEGAGRLVDEDVLGTVRIQAESVDPDVGVFVGVARTADVEQYLNGVAQDEVTDFDLGPSRATILRHPGGAPRSAPTEQQIWAAQASGRGLQTLEWKSQSGRWTVVAMNEDGTRAIDVRLRAGAELGFLDWLGGALLGVGALVGVLGAGLIVLGARGSRARSNANPDEGGTR